MANTYPLRFTVTKNMMYELQLSLLADVGCNGPEVELVGQDAWKRCFHRAKTRIVIETPEELLEAALGVDDVADRCSDWESPSLKRGLDRVAREMMSALKEEV